MYRLWKCRCEAPLERLSRYCLGLTALFLVQLQWEAVRPALPRWVGSLWRKGTYCRWSNSVAAKEVAALPGNNPSVALGDPALANGELFHRWQHGLHFSQWLGLAFWNLGPFEGEWSKADLFGRSLVVAFFPYGSLVKFIFLNVPCWRPAVSV